MPASLHVEISGLTEAGRRLKRAADAGRDLTPLMSEIGEYLVRSTKERFNTETDPTGKPWAPLSEEYRARKKQNRDKILTLSRDLAGSVAFRAARAHVDAGVRPIYSGTHQFGAAKGSFGSTSKGSPIPWGDIPARPFLGLSDEDEREITQIVVDYLDEAFGGAV